MIDQARQICITLLQGIKNPTVTDINSAIENVTKIFPSVSAEKENLFKFLEAQFSVFSDNYQILTDPDTYVPWIKSKKADIHMEFLEKIFNVSATKT